MGGKLVPARGATTFHPSKQDGQSTSPGQKRGEAPLKTAMMDVITCGEMLIDFISTEVGVCLAQAPAFKKAPGGAPANVAVGVARLGYRAGFIGQVGNDEFGHFLADTLQSHGVDTTGLRFTSLARTALAFVSLR